MAGTPRANWLVSQTTATSAFSSAVWVLDELFEVDGADFFFAFDEEREVDAAAPPAACQARRASTWHQTWPLSSTAPRA